MSSTPITLESNPLEKDYEDYICAHFQCGGYYVEKSIIHRETEEILELDIIITDFNSEGTTKKLVEIKSGGWGFNEIFKVKGWLVYLKVEHGLFIVKKTRNSLDYFQRKAQELDIHLIDNCDSLRSNVSSRALCVGQGPLDLLFTFYQKSLLLILLFFFGSFFFYNSHKKCG